MNPGFLAATGLGLIAILALKSKTASAATPSGPLPSGGGGTAPSNPSNPFNPSPGGGSSTTPTDSGGGYVTPYDPNSGQGGNDGGSGTILGPGGSNTNSSTWDSGSGTSDGSQTLGPASVYTGTDPGTDWTSVWGVPSAGAVPGPHGRLGQAAFTGRQMNASERAGLRGRRPSAGYYQGDGFMTTCMLSTGELGVLVANARPDGSPGWVPYYPGAELGQPPPSGLLVY